MSKMTDEEIVASLYAGDGSAFHLLYDRYAERGKSYANTFLQNHSDSEEAVQEAFFRLLKPLSAGRVAGDRGGFCAIYFGTLRNLCIDMLRKRSRRTHVPLDAVHEASSGPCEGEVCGKGLEEFVRSALEALPPRQADALKLRLNGGLSYDRIAETLGGTRGQVRSWIYRARRGLEAALREKGFIEDKE